MSPLETPPLFMFKLTGLPKLKLTPLRLRVWDPEEDVVMDEEDDEEEDEEDSLELELESEPEIDPEIGREGEGNKVDPEDEDEEVKLLTVEALPAFPTAIPCPLRLTLRRTT